MFSAESSSSGSFVPPVASTHSKIGPLSSLDVRQVWPKVSGPPPSGSAAPAAVKPTVCSRSS